MDMTPKLPAWYYPDNIHIIVWCKYCKKYHWHGRKGNTGEGHRVAHCVLNTPYRMTGYELLPAGPASKSILKDIKLQRHKGPKDSREVKEKIKNLKSFTTFIKKQQSENSHLGDYARDFKFILDHMPMYPEYRGTDEITSETLYGHYCFLDDRAKKRDYILEALFELWREWIKYKHIGLKYREPKRGYVYIFKLENEDDIFKIGRTEQEPEKRLLEVARQERAKVTVYDWLQIDFYELIEKELHVVFKKNQIMREWFRIDRKEIDKAIRLYSLTDPTCVVKSYQEYQEDDDVEDESKVNLL